MKVKCVLCGKEEDLSKLHKDYKKIAENPKTAYFCEVCSLKLANQASKDNAVLKNK